jgi:3-deoxy-manno-octulosonate cytidylyltransferase (CMP-KDO synthetase)
MSAGSAEILVVIPARYASTRFPGKVLAPLHGKPLVLHAYDRLREAPALAEVIVATDDERVVDVVHAHGGEVALTAPEHASGTDRVAEVARARNADIVVNVQGDEPLVDPALVLEVAGALAGNPDADMATARRRITSREHLDDPNVVKVVCDGAGRALYFSRAPIPHPRDAADEGSAAWQHIGLYAYRRDFLLEFATWPPTPLEQCEKLEQLRALEHGRTIMVVDTMYESIGVDTPADLERVEHQLAER